MAIMQGHQSWVLKVAASPDGKLLGSGYVHLHVHVPCVGDTMSRLFEMRDYDADIGL